MIDMTDKIIMEYKDVYVIRRTAELIRDNIFDNKIDYAKKRLFKLIDNLKPVSFYIEGEIKMGLRDADGNYDKDRLKQAILSDWAVSQNL